MRRDLHVLILEDHDIVSFTVAAILKDVIPNVQVTIARSFTKGVSLMEHGHLIDLVILDVSLPGADGPNMVPTLRRIQESVRILIFTGNEEFALALQFLNAGANGYLTKNHPMEEISLAIKTIFNGQRYITEELKQIVVENSVKLSKPVSISEISDLSPREKEVMALLLDGKKTKQISSELNLKITTVSAHKARIFEKLQVCNVIELFKKLRLST